MSSHVNDPNQTRHQEPIEAVEIREANRISAPSGNSDGGDSDQESGPEAAGDSSFDVGHDYPLRVPTLTNSPGCRPGFGAIGTGITAVPPISSAAISAAPVSAAPVSAAAPISAAAPSRQRTAAPLRRVRKVRVDAWATPAAATWSRTRKTVRKVNRQPHSTSWALPF